MQWEIHQTPDRWTCQDLGVRFPYRVISDKDFKLGDHTDLNMCSIHLFEMYLNR